MFESYTLELGGHDGDSPAEPSWPTSIPEHEEALNVVRCIASLEKADEVFLRGENHVAYYYKVVEQLTKLFPALERLNHLIDSMQDGGARSEGQYDPKNLVDVGYLDIKLDEDSRTAYRRDAHADFGNYEHSWDVFEELCRAKGHVVRSPRLLTAGWGDALAMNPNLQIEISRILKFTEHLQLQIENMRNIGYKLVDAG